VAAVRAVRVERSGKVAGKDPENPDPDRYVENPIVILISFPFDDFFHECPEEF
jgi:hypothetical protein